MNLKISKLINALEEHKENNVVDNILMELVDIISIHHSDLEGVDDLSVDETKDILNEFESYIDLIINQIRTGEVECEKEAITFIKWLKFQVRLSLRNCYFELASYKDLEDIVIKYKKKYFEKEESFKKKLTESINKGIKIHEVDKDGLPDVDREFIAFASGHEEYQILTRQNKGKIENSNWDDKEGHRSDDGEYYAGKNGWIYKVTFNRYIYLDELDLIDNNFKNKVSSEQEETQKKYDSIIDKLNSLYGKEDGEKLANAFINFGKDDRTVSLISYASYLIEPVDYAHAIRGLYGFLEEKFDKEFAKKIINKVLIRENGSEKPATTGYEIDIKPGFELDDFWNNILMSDNAKGVIKDNKLYIKPLIKKFSIDTDDIKSWLSSRKLFGGIRKYFNLISRDECDKIFNNNLLESNLINESLKEDIEKHDKLNDKLFDENEELIPEVKERVLEIADKFVEMLKEDEIKATVKDVVLIGSNVSYNYTKDSDLDVHIILDSSDLKCPDGLYDKLYSAYRSIFNKNYDITIKGIPVEIYVELDETNAKSNGVYSLNDGWIKKPEQIEIPEIDKDKFNSELEPRLNKAEDLIGSAEDALEEDFEDDEDSINLAGKSIEEI